MATLEALRNFIKENTNQTCTVTSQVRRPVISVYAICKNEINNVVDWVNQFKKCDYVCVLDTGSTDGTYEKLKELANNDSRLIVRQKFYEEFHFDEARNDSFKLVPNNTTVCLLLDFDERLQSDWYEVLMNKYKDTIENKSLYILRKVYNSGVYDGEYNHRPFSQPYEFMKYHLWAGYAAENFINNFTDDRAELIDKNFKIFAVKEIDDIYCNHYVISGLCTVAKNFDGKKKFVTFFEDMHHRIQKSNDFLNVISLMSARFTDYNSFRHIFIPYAQISDPIIEQDINHLIDIIYKNKVDLNKFKNMDVQSFILDTIIKHRIIYFGDNNIVDKVKKALIDNSSDKEETNWLFEDVRRLQINDMKGKVRYENN